MAPKKIIITGGHVTPALAVIDALHKNSPDTTVVFVGRKYNNNREKTESFEYQEVVRRSTKFYHLTTGRLTRSVSIETIQNLFTIPWGFVQAWQILRYEKPDLVLSFGGYLALPMAIIASWLSIPVYTHEQTIHPGLANQKIAKVAQKVFISFPESAPFFPKDKTVVTGNPIRESVFTVKKDVTIPRDVPCIYVTGGSLGAHAINVHLEHIIRDLVTSYVVIHQTGNLHEYNDYERLTGIKDTLPKDVQSRYILKTHVGDDEIGSIFKQADLVISRAGANTFYELVALKKPAVLIPLPLAAFDEQRKQAQVLKDAGVAEIFEQNRPSEELLATILQVLTNKQTYEREYEKLKADYNTKAAARIVEEIFNERNS